MTDAATVKKYGKDPKQVLDEAIEEAFVDEQVVIMTPKTRGLPAQVRTLLPRFAALIATAVSVSVAATLISRIVARRRLISGRTVFRRGMRGRRFGYSGYRFGRFGRAFLAYSYKVPQVHIHLPQMTYKIPSIRVKLPTPSR